MKKGRTLTATSLRIILVISLFLIAVLSVIGFSLAADGLTSAAVVTSESVGKANNSRDNIQMLQQLQVELERNKQAAERAKSIVAESKSYQYQDQIIQDLTNYANRAGLAITNIDFGSTTSTSVPAPGATQTPAKTVPAGINSTPVSISLKNPIDYTNLLRFLYSIEQNLTKMQISRVGFSKQETGGVTSDSLTIEVFVR